MGHYNRIASMLPPASRKADPITSKAADRAITHSGKRSGDVLKAAELVKLHPGSTCRELAKLGVMDNESLHKRLPDAASPEVGLIERGLDRVCFVTGRRAVTWWPKGYGE